MLAAGLTTPTLRPHADAPGVVSESAQFMATAHSGRGQEDEAPLALAGANDALAHAADEVLALAHAEALLVLADHSRHHRGLSGVQRVRRVRRGARQLVGRVVQPHQVPAASKVTETCVRPAPPLGWELDRPPARTQT